ncbi:GntR family transcriptional regulator [Kitasatospora sp. MAP12-15]|uniref:GntR family transcriptional regulator n=1 Tax=unclassified Kitasatospora TaxID=2633591 RepID=UPI00247330B5|nr:GntR family transcriptional regulator [Kitasatospora sp. MAP12-44]MDH6109754.1 GntR family transcriptional regulator [Kitasatospora sp. MAP12-44]
MAGTGSTFSRIADHYRQAILAGELEAGTRLPTQREMCQRWNVASATVGRALQALQVEGYVRTSPRGTFVADEAAVTGSGRDRLLQVQRIQSSLMGGETCTVTVAELGVPPLYVQDLFNLDPGDQLVRREFVTGKGRQRTMYQGVYYPAEFAAMVPDLLSKAAGKNAGILGKVLVVSGRTITHARDDMHGRAANAREASALGIAVGSPILAGVHRWSDEDGIIEYGEWCIPTRFTIGYEYNPQRP